MSTDWCTIESDPGVFTELVELTLAHGFIPVQLLYKL